MWNHLYIRKVWRQSPRVGESDVRFRDIEVEKNLGVNTPLSGPCLVGVTQELSLLNFPDIADRTACKHWECVERGRRAGLR